MSDMYLTKVERKTIFTQGLIYVLFTFLISDLTVVGPQVFCAIPWLFILGILGTSKFYHPVLTVVISGVTTFMASLFRYNLGIETLTSTVISMMVVSCGIVVGLCIKEFILEYRLVKHLSVKKKVINVTIITALTILSLFIYACKYGNIVSYISSRVALNNYIGQSNVEEYSVEKCQYVVGSFYKYVYKVNTPEGSLNFKVANNIEIIDFDTWRDNLEEKLNANFTVPRGNYKITLSYDFTEVKILPDSIVAVVTIDNVEPSDEAVLQQILDLIKATIQYRDKFNINVEKCVLSINKGVQILSKEEFKNIDKEYIRKCFNVENLDVN